MFLGLGPKVRLGSTQRKGHMLTASTLVLPMVGISSLGAGDGVQ